MVPVRALLFSTHMSPVPCEPRTVGGKRMDTRHTGDRSPLCHTQLIVNTVSKDESFIGEVYLMIVWWKTDIKITGARHAKVCNKVSRRVGRRATLSWLDIIEHLIKALRQALRLFGDSGLTSLNIKWNNFIKRLPTVGGAMIVLSREHDGWWGGVATTPAGRLQH